MSELVDPNQIEQIVGMKRLNSQHLARAVSEEETVYILHAHQCLRSGVDLRECPFSLALDRGIEWSTWVGWLDQPVQVLVRDQRLVPRQPPL